MGDNFVGDELKKLINAIGSIGEMALLFYRTILSSGASAAEAMNVTQAFIAAIVFGGGNKKEDNS